MVIIPIDEELCFPQPFFNITSIPIITHWFVRYRTYSSEKPEIISGTISEDQITSVEHNLEAEKIAGLMITIKDSSNDLYIAPPYNVYQIVNYWYDDTNIYIDRNGYDVVGEPFKVTIFLAD